jgi:ATP synthase F1 gamma subunit
VYLRKFKDISKAVQLVAIAKLRKLNKVIESREYALYLALEMFDELNSLDNTAVRNTVVIITSEKSCCGKLNSDVLSASKDAIDTYIEENKLLRIISVGWKGRNSLASKFKSFLCKSVSGVGKVSFFLSYVITLCVFDTDFDKCAVYFSKYYKIFEQLAAMYEFRSFTIFFDYAYKTRKENLFFDLLLSNCLLVVNNLYSYNVCLVIFDAFEETKYSELGCRAFSMEMAYKNATELINVKMLIYNKARQAAITTDLLEVVAGAIYTV